MKITCNKIGIFVVYFQPNMLFEIMQSALILNRVSFVELLMDNGVNLKDFLTLKRLLKLYNHVRKLCVFQRNVAFQIPCTIFD